MNLPGETLCAIDAAVAARVRRMARQGATTGEILAFVRSWDVRVDEARGPGDLATLLNELEDHSMNIEITDRQLADLQDWAARQGRHELVADCELALQAGEGMGATAVEAREARSRCADAMAGLVIIETMPDCHRASHRAGGHWGAYPANGAERTWMTEDEADEIISSDPDGYAHVVRRVVE